MKRILFTAALMSLMWTVAVAEPSDSLLNYIKHAMLFNKVYPQEKVYLHFDNTGYFKGEHIWFKAYVTRADLQTPTDVSRVLYVEMLNPSGDVVERRKLLIENGVAHGDILLDSILGTGFYEIRAYTRYMMNWGGQTAFSRVFPIFRKPQQEGDYSKPTIDRIGIHQRLPEREQTQDAAALAGADRNARQGKLKVKFYPEGGDLVEGLRSRVAFEVMDEDGRHVPAVGMLVDKQDESQSIVRADETGRGLFEVDATGELSLLVLTDADGKKYEFHLPQPKAEGCVVRMTVSDPEGISAEIRSSSRMQGCLLGYTVMCGGQITHVDTLTAEPVVKIGFKRESLRPGVNQLTVFTSDGRVQAERLFFVAPQDLTGQRIQIVNQTNEPRPCGKISLDLQSVPNASLSFSAMDERTLTNGKEGNILSYMLLSSDLKGYIPNPEYFLEADDVEHRLAADTLMLINGWRRYDWRVMSDVEPWDGERQQIEDKLYVFGQLAPALGALKRKNPVHDVDMTVYLFNEKGEHLTGHTVTDSVGNYAFALPDNVMGDWNMQIKTRIEEKLKSYSVKINRRFSPKARFVFPEETEMMPKNKANLFKRSEQFAQNDDDADNQSAIIAQTGNNEFSIKTVKIKARRRYWTDYNGGWYNENTGRRLAELYYDVSDAADEIGDRGEAIPTLDEWLAKKNNLYKSDPTFIMPDSGGFVNLAGPRYDGRPIVWMLNNNFFAATSLPFSDTRMEQVVENAFIPDRNLKSYPTFIDEVKSVYIVSANPQVMTPYIRSVDILGSNPVVIFVYTYPSYSTESKKGTRRTHFQGFNVPSTFEMEDYSIMPPMEDFRRTLYWNPDVKTDAAGKAHVEFYNNSSAHEMLLSVEGMTRDGRFLSNE
ncbi:MAG: hypothetical protein Q4E32_08685 [Bacteroidales bacterium]|nr:hypothetical protein [Bacteroidales bacterium]